MATNMAKMPQPMPLHAIPAARLAVVDTPARRSRGIVTARMIQ